MEHSEQKRSRASTSKVRTGCITCKSRHIKCDEAKPHCMKCLTPRGHCEGYATKPRKKLALLGELRWDSRRSAQAAASRGMMVPVQIDPDSVDFRDATALFYFQEFVGLAQGPWISATSNDDLWEVILPQMARRNDVLRSAAIAIGALSTWRHQPGCESICADLETAFPAVEDSHHLHATAYYCHSIKLQCQRASPQDAVFLSLLLLFFERLRGNKQAALDHVNHGLTLLLTILTDKNTQYHVAKISPNPKPLLKAVMDIFTHLTTQVRTILRGRIGQGPSLPNLERELRNKEHTMESFMLLLGQLQRSTVANDKIPAVINSIQEFEEYWAISRCRQTKIISIMAEAIQSSNVHGVKDEYSMDDFLLGLLGNPGIKKFCEDSRKEMQALDAAFLPLYNRIIMSDTKSPEYLKAVHLRLQYLASYAIDDPTQYLDVETLHSQTPLFRKYLSLAEIVLHTARRDIRKPTHLLSLRRGLAWYLLTTALFCRDPLVREEAVWMLRDYPGQDGLWNTHSLYLLALRNRHIERTNALEGTPAEQWRRLRRREFVFENCGNRIVLRYLAKDHDMNKWQLIEEAAEVWPKSEDANWTRQPLTESEGSLMGDLYSA
ncbi:hypothetical protein J3F84DRAFT_388190 [Trichoderma pleuroticola]